MIPAGTYLPPHVGAAVFTALSLSTWHGLNQPEQVVLALAAGIPMAWLGKKVETLLRSAQGRCHEKAQAWAGGPSNTPFPERLIYHTMLRSFLVSWIFFLGTLLLVNPVFEQCLHVARSIPPGIHLSWPQLWLAASLGGLLALRVQRAYALFFTGTAVVALAIFSQSL